MSYPFYASDFSLCRICVYFIELFVFVSFLLLLQVTREDARLLSAAVTFYQLHECCSSRSKPSHPSAMMSLQPDQFQASVPMALSSLLPHSQVVGILFTAFSQPSEGAEGEERTGSYVCERCSVHLCRCCVEGFTHSMFLKFVTMETRGGYGNCMVKWIPSCCRCLIGAMWHNGTLLYL